MAMEESEATEMWRLATQGVVHLNKAQASTPVFGALLCLQSLQEVARLAGADVEAARSLVVYNPA